MLRSKLVSFQYVSVCGCKISLYARGIPHFRNTNTLGCGVPLKRLRKISRVHRSDLLFFGLTHGCGAPLKRFSRSFATERGGKRKKKEEIEEQQQQQQKQQLTIATNNNYTPPLLLPPTS